jgi:phosphonate transport system permease protein
MAIDRRPFPIGRRGLVLLSIGAAGAWAFLHLGLGRGTDHSAGGGLSACLDFFSHAFSPALDYESSSVPADATPFLVGVLDAMRRTVVFAAAAMSLSLVIGVVLGFPASTAWWEGDPAGSRTALGRFLRSTVAPSVYGAARVLITAMRSVHELLWAVLFLAAFGLTTMSAVIAISIPYGGTLAKIFSEIIDETSRGSARALRAAGAGSVSVFAFGLLPRALPDMTAYAFYRTECAIRSAAILGFFGFPTLGYYIKQSFDNLQYGEVWTYLYAVFLLVFLVDTWSGALRRRFVGHE